MQHARFLVVLAWLAVFAQSYSRSDVAIVLIACGHVAREGLVTLCVTSIRDQGHWTGAVYLFTDAIECAPRGVSIVPIAFDKSCEDDDLMYKSLKMLILQETTERYLLYVDVDVIVAKPLQSFVAMSIERIQNSSLVVYDEVSVTPDPVHAKRLNREPYHGGVFFAERFNSESCLFAWRSKILERIQGNGEMTTHTATSSLRDQPLLRECVEEGRCSVSFFESDTLLKPNATTITRGYYATLNHLGRTSRLKRAHNRHNMTGFHLKRIGLDLLHLPLTRSGRSWWLDPPANCNKSNATQQPHSRRRRKSSVRCVSTSRVRETLMFSPSNALEMWIFFSLVWCGASAFTAHSDHTVVRGALSESELVELRQFAASVLGREEWNDVRESDVTSRRRTSDGRRGAVTAVEEASSVLDKWTLPIASELNWEMPFQQEFAHNDLQVCAYASGDFFDRHLDDETRGLSGYKRLTTICMLSDDFEGGDLELNGNLWRLRAGDLAVFEAGSCEHAVLPVASGIRVSLVAGIFWRC